MYPKNSPTESPLFMQCERERGRTNLGLELDRACHPSPFARYRARVAKLKGHFSEKHTPRVHVRHRDHILWVRILINLTVI